MIGLSQRFHNVKEVSHGLYHRTGRPPTPRRPSLRLQSPSPHCPSPLRPRSPQAPRRPLPPCPLTCPRPPRQACWPQPPRTARRLGQAARRRPHHPLWPLPPHHAPSEHLEPHPWLSRRPARL